MRMRAAALATAVLLLAPALSAQDLLSRLFTPKPVLTTGLSNVLRDLPLLDAGEQLTEEEFFEYCKAEMVKYKRPVEVRFVDALPKTGANKINRPALRNLL